MAVTPAEGRCQSCQQTRPLFTFAWIPRGWAEFVNAELCTRCYSAAKVEDVQYGLEYDVFGEVAA
ncbi:hypothetical protein OG592_27295 [Streptomyces avidinii]|uniref:hypothetical protein n=1 Tax=Streptomyces avidinii TaxID=1895 RepID=UPI00386A212A|nr:hypothetical protein OG592_27295 [Streptomyces avidinii]